MKGRSGYMEKDENCDRRHSAPHLHTSASPTMGRYSWFIAAACTRASASRTDGSTTGAPSSSRYAPMPSPICVCVSGVRGGEPLVRSKEQSAAVPCEEVVVAISTLQQTVAVVAMAVHRKRAPCWASRRG